MGWVDTYLIVARIVVLLYAFIILGGGVFAFYKFKSKISLYVSIGVCVLLLVAFVMSWLISPFGFLVAAILAAVLMVFFFLRYYSTEKVMPGVPMSVLSLIALIFAGIAMVLSFL
ncbi:hypothetical protein QOT17_010211 [Balamuthia mandrillaris]